MNKLDQKKEFKLPKHKNWWGLVWFFYSKSTNCDDLCTDDTFLELKFRTLYKVSWWLQYVVWICWSEIRLTVAQYRVANYQHPPPPATLSWLDTADPNMLKSVNCSGRWCLHTIWAWLNFTWCAPCFLPPGGIRDFNLASPYSALTLY